MSSKAVEALTAAFASNRDTSSFRMAGTWICRFAAWGRVVRTAAESLGGTEENKFEGAWNELPPAGFLVQRRMECPPAPNPSPIRRIDPGPLRRRGLLFSWN